MKKPIFTALLAGLSLGCGVYCILIKADPMTAAMYIGGSLSLSLLCFYQIAKK